MRILLDENLPEGLSGPLGRLGHTVDSVVSLRLKGLDNGRLYREVASGYDLFFTKDRAFATAVGTLTEPAPVRVILTVGPRSRRCANGQAQGEVLECSSASPASPSRCKLGGGAPLPDGHDVVHVAELSLSVDGEEVLQQASARRAALLTADKDFGELVR